MPTERKTIACSVLTEKEKNIALRQCNSISAENIPIQNVHSMSSTNYDTKIQESSSPSESIIFKEEESVTDLITEFGNCCSFSTQENPEQVNDARTSEKIRNTVAITGEDKVPIIAKNELTRTSETSSAEKQPAGRRTVAVLSTISENPHEIDMTSRSTSSKHSVIPSIPPLSKDRSSKIRTTQKRVVKLQEPIKETHETTPNGEATKLSDAETHGDSASPYQSFDGSSNKQSTTSLRESVRRSRKRLLEAVSRMSTDETAYKDPKPSSVSAASAASILHPSYVAIADEKIRTRDRHLSVASNSGQKNAGSGAASCFWRLLVLLIFLCGFGFAVYYFATNRRKAGSDNNDNDSLHSLKIPLRDETVKCPKFPPSERVVVYWQTEQEGCATLPNNVTHVVLGFIQVQNSTAVPQFQSSDTGIKKCIVALRSRCIYVLAGIGGANNNDGMTNIQDPEKFAQSVLKVMVKYSLDGVDIDDLTVGNQYDANRVKKYMQALARVLKPNAFSRSIAATTIGNRDNSTDTGRRIRRLGLSTTVTNDYLLVYDALMLEGLPAACSDKQISSFIRCFPTSIVPYVDFVNIMAYNIETNPTKANQIYSDAVANVFEEWRNDVFDGDGTKATIGICVNKGCAFGPGPSDQIVKQWTRYAKRYGGMMVYAGSFDYLQNYQKINLIVSRLQS